MGTLPRGYVRGIVEAKHDTRNPNPTVEQFEGTGPNGERLFLRSERSWEVLRSGLMRADEDPTKNLYGPAALTPTRVSTGVAAKVIARETGHAVKPIGLYEIDGRDIRVEPWYPHISIGNPVGERKDKAVDTLAAVMPGILRDVFAIPFSEFERASKKANRPVLPSANAIDPTNTLASVFGRAVRQQTWLSRFGQGKSPLVDDFTREVTRVLGVPVDAFTRLGGIRTVEAPPGSVDPNIQIRHILMKKENDKNPKITENSITPASFAYATGRFAGGANFTKKQAAVFYGNAVKMAPPGQERSMEKDYHHYKYLHEVLRLATMAGRVDRGVSREMSPDEYMGMIAKNVQGITGYANRMRAEYWGTPPLDPGNVLNNITDAAISQQRIKTSPRVYSLAGLSRTPAAEASPAPQRKRRHAAPPAQPPAARRDRGPAELVRTSQRGELWS